MKNKFRYIELFGGIGALTQALKKLKIDAELVDYVEIDKYAVKSFNAMNGTNFEPQDITTWNKDLKDIDLIMHGSPCQDFSLAGKQAGGDEGSGTRSSLMYETIRIVEKLRPKYVIWENVKNLLSKNHKHNFDAYLETMESLGYVNYYQVLNSKDYEIPQKRERVFTISIRDDGNFCFENYIEDLSTYFKFPPKQELKLRFKDMLENEVDEKYYLTTDKINKIAHWKAYQKPFEKVLGNNSVCPTLTARGAGEEHSGMIIYSDKLEETTNLQDECLNIKLPGAYGRNFGSKGKLQNQDGICDTLVAAMGTGGGNIPLINDLGIRKITPKECWRLMGFNDEAYEKASQVNSNTQLYKQAGNSIVVNVLEAILKNLLEL